MDKQKEAIFRLEKLNLDSEVLKGFQEGNVYLSDELGNLCKLDKTCKDVIKYLEERNLLVYHILKTSTNFGLMYSFLYVSDSEDDWEYERPTKSYVATYCYNKTIPDYSEFGDIFFEVVNGKITRLN